MNQCGSLMPLGFRVDGDVVGTIIDSAGFQLSHRLLCNPFPPENPFMGGVLGDHFLIPDYGLPLVDGSILFLKTHSSAIVVPLAPTQSGPIHAVHDFMLKAHTFFPCPSLEGAFRQCYDGAPSLRVLDLPKNLSEKAKGTHAKVRLPLLSVLFEEEKSR